MLRRDRPRQIGEGLGEISNGDDREPEVADAERDQPHGVQEEARLPASVDQARRRDERGQRGERSGGYPDV